MAEKDWQDYFDKMVGNRRWAITLILENRPHVQLDEVFEEADRLVQYIYKDVPARTVTFSGTAA